jgi:flagellar hook-associated protein 3 FlgL
MAIRLNPDIVPNLLLAIQQSTQSLDTAEQQLASGLRVNQLSDDPGAAASLVHDHDQAGQDDQFLQNLSTLQGRFQQADSAMTSVVSVLTSALSLGTEGANGTLNTSDRQAIASQVQGLLTQMVSLGNSSYQGTYLFAGTAVDKEPFVLNSANNTVSYAGNSDVTTMQLSNSAVTKGNVPGSQIFQNASGNVFQALTDLTNALQSGNNIGTAVTEVQNALSSVSTQRVFYGNALNQINLSENFLNQDKINLSSQENTLVGADPVEAATNLAQAQVANQASIQATSEILNRPTILDYVV